ncbi:Glycoside hydrolase superfamily [Penicillium cf. griseofulvum]|nr:Glycoside hydrolase superfamily [Penicillium cf. griseofulvum]
MKGAIFAAALVGSAMADGVHRRHDAFHQRREAASSSWASAVTSTIPQKAGETCGCVTKVITYYGDATLVPIKASTPVPESSTTVPESTTTLTSTYQHFDCYRLGFFPPATSSIPAVVLPTPGVSTFTTPGIYTIPATTITVRDTTTVCGATSTDIPSGTHTYGGVTTIVSTATTVTCPYATVKPSGSTVTSVIETTTYVCPSAGTYTVVPPTTTSVPTSTVLVYPTPHTVVPGTYTQDESVITVTRTDYTYVCPAPTNALASTTAPAPAPTTVVATTTAPAVTTTTAAAVTSKPTSSKTSVVSKPTGVPTELGEGQYGMTYSPYTAGGQCKTKQEVLKDLTVIKGKGFNLVRVYSTDCSGIEFIGDACKELSIKIIMGVFIDGSGTAGAQQQVTEISKWAQWDMVELIVVGNEAIQSGAVDAATLAGFIQSASSSFKAAGYTGLITTTEPINVWQQHGPGALCAAVDIVGANIHPFFNADVTAEMAGEFTKGEFEELEKICGGKDVINLETGWPNAGNANGAAIPGPSQQAAAIKSIAKHVGSKSIFFSFSDDTWKNPGEFDVEQHWGCSGVF